MDEEQKDKEKRRLRILIEIIIIIILILLLLIKCNAKWFGKIGGFFNNESNVNIKPDDGTEQIIWDKDLKFNRKELKFSVSDKDARISYHYENINPKEFTCTTSDAKIAVCYVEKDYVVIVPKGTGQTDVILETKVNGKIYRAKASITIEESEKYIQLSSKKGTIDLNSNNSLNISFQLFNLKGEVHVSISDSDIADVEIVDGVLKVVGKKVGSAEVTLTVQENGKTYQETFTVTVTKEENNTPSSNTNTNSHSNSNSNSNSNPKKDHDSTLSDLDISIGDLEFEKDVYHYDVTVSYEEDEFSMESSLSSKKAKAEYWFNGKKVNSLKGLKLNVGENHLKITVTAEDGSTSTYEIDIYRSEKVLKDSSLKSLEVSKGVLSPSFDKDILKYEVVIDASVTDIDITGIPTESSSKLTYRYHGEVVNSLEDLELNPGDNEVEIVVTSEDGNSTTYTVNVYRKERKIEFQEKSYTTYLEDGVLEIEYSVLEYNRDTKTWDKVEDYDPKDFLVEYDGNYSIEKGKITITPTKDDLHTTKELKIKDQSTSSTSITVERYEYELEPETGRYEFNVDAGGSIILQNNLLGDDVTIEKIEGGIRISNKENPELYVDILGDVTVTYDGGTSSLVIHVDSKQVGLHDITVKGFAYGEEVNSFTITCQMFTEYIVNLFANGGFYNEFATEINLKLKSGSSLNLKEYEAYLYSSETCEYLKMVGYSKRKDAKEGDPDVYPVDSVINIEGNLDLYAVYSDSEITEPNTNKWLYLADVDLFKNEEYFKAYGIEKMIYPGAEGTYLMNFTNHTDKDVVITGISLSEKTICVDDGCINMGYKIVPKNQDSVYGNSEYQILNQDEEETDEEQDTFIGVHDMDVSIPSGESKDILITWKWVELSDELDTKIGNYVAETGNNIYSLTVGIRFRTIENECKKG